MAKAAHSPGIGASVGAIESAVPTGATPAGAVTATKSLLYSTPFSVTGVRAVASALLVASGRSAAGRGDPSMRCTGEHPATKATTTAATPKPVNNRLPRRPHGVVRLIPINFSILDTPLRGSRCNA